MLAGLHQGALEDAQVREQTVSLDDLKAKISQQTPAIDAYAFFKRNDQPKIIAEIKRSSPSRGNLAEVADPSSLARQYEAGGASAISVLTEGRKFGGSLEDLVAVRSAVNIPVLRKDFMGSTYQVYEARAFGADIILIILAAVDDETAKELYDLAHELGMAVLVEVHDQEELDRAIALDATMIGINARNLKTFELDRSIYPKLASQLSESVIKVAESAVTEKSHFVEYCDAGADVVLIGEALVTDGNPESTIRHYLER